MKTSKQPPLAKASVLSAVLGFILILVAVTLNSNHILSFFNLEGLIIVIGGVMAVAFMSFDNADVKQALKAIKTSFQEPVITHKNLYQEMTKIIDWAHTVRTRGMRGLESDIGEEALDDAFIRYGLTMVISDYTPNEIRGMMETAADAYYERDIVQVNVLQSMASHAPAFGMLGTLVGMVSMLYTLNDNVTNIGAGLAIAFLSTLYGVLTARMVYMPAASKFCQKLDMYRFRNQLITEGMVMLVDNKSPTYIQDHLNSFLCPDTHNYFSIQNQKRKKAEVIKAFEKTRDKLRAAHS